MRVNVRNGVIEEFAVNKGKANGPASKIGGGGLERPVAARFSPDGKSLYVVDFGVLLQKGKRANRKKAPACFGALLATEVLDEND